MAGRRTWHKRSARRITVRPRRGPAACPQTTSHPRFNPWRSAVALALGAPGWHWRSPQLSCVLSPPRQEVPLAARARKAATTGSWTAGSMGAPTSSMSRPGSIATRAMPARKNSRSNPAAPAAARRSSMQRRDARAIRSRRERARLTRQFRSGRTARFLHGLRQQERLPARDTGRARACGGEGLAAAPVKLAAAVREELAAPRMRSTASLPHRSGFARCDQAVRHRADRPYPLLAPVVGSPSRRDWVRPVICCSTAASASPSITVARPSPPSKRAARRSGW